MSGIQRVPLAPPAPRPSDETIAFDDRNSFGTGGASGARTSSITLTSNGRQTTTRPSGIRHQVWAPFPHREAFESASGGRKSPESGSPSKTAIAGCPAASRRAARSLDRRSARSTDSGDFRPPLADAMGAWHREVDEPLPRAPDAERAAGLLPHVPFSLLGRRRVASSRSGEPEG
jgi:hypothetical protein